MYTGQFDTTYDITEYVRKLSSLGANIEAIAGLPDSITEILALEK